MILKEEVHHPNDISFKFLQTTHPEMLHKYFNLPGKFIRNFPARIVRRDGSEREMDWLMLVETEDGEKLLINVEFQSDKVGFQKIKAISDYRDYAKTYYNLPVLIVIVIMKGWNSSIKEYKKTDSDILKPKYFYMKTDEIEKRFNNVCNKIVNQDMLTEEEVLDIAFLPMFAPSKMAKNITEKFVKTISQGEFMSELLYSDISYVLGIMVRKYLIILKKLGSCWA